MIRYPRPKNPPPPPGWKFPTHVPPDVTEWATEVLHDADEFPLPAANDPDDRSTDMAEFGGVLYGARVEYHTWVGATGDQHPEGIRGVTVYAIDEDAVRASV